MTYRLTTILLLYFYCTQFYGQSDEPTIHFEGLNKTKESYLLRAFGNTNYGTIDGSFLERQIGFLERMPGIINATFKYDPKENPDTVFYVVEEAWTLLPDVNFQNADGLTTLRIGFQEFNLSGRGIQLKAALQYNGKTSFFIESEIPYLVGNFGAKGILHKVKSDEPFYVPNNTTAFYEKDAFIAEGFINWNININHKIEIGAGIIEEQYSQLENNMEMLNPLYPEQLGFNKYSFRSNYFFNTISYDYYELDGWKNELNVLKIVDVNFPMDFNQLVNSLHYYKQLEKSGGNLAFRLQTAFATNNDSPLAPITIDSQLNFRGVGDRVDRGTGSILLNSEYRYPVYDRTFFASQIVVFSDYGFLRLPGKEFNFEGPEARWHAGLGMRFIFKKAFNSVLRLDYGWGLDKYQQQGLVIGLGQYF